MVNPGLTCRVVYGNFGNMNMFTEKIILTVSRLTSILKDLLVENFGQVWVEGDVSNPSFPASGHIYFTLKDHGAILRCVMFRSSAKSLKFRIEEGMSLIIRGHVSVYDQRGEYQLITEYAEPKGAGAMQVAFIQLKERMEREGLFSNAHKQPLPALPQRVGVITSASGAALHDILTVLGRRHAGVSILICPVLVQGEGAAKEISSAINDMNRLQAADVLIVGRGGGSQEDLWAFNEELVARAVYSSQIPVISAVGHETDWTICDFVADLRAATPSVAAELVCIGRVELLQRLSNLYHLLQQSVIRLISVWRHRFEGLTRSLHDPSRLLEYQAQRIDDISVHLELGIRNLLSRRMEQVIHLEQRLYGLHPDARISRQRQNLLLLSEKAERMITRQLELMLRFYGEATARLETLSPLRTMSRGFAVVELKTDGHIVKSAEELHTGEDVRLRLHHGGAICTVKETYKDSGVKATT